MLFHIPVKASIFSLALSLDPLNLVIKVILAAVLQVIKILVVGVLDAQGSELLVCGLLPIAAEALGPPARQRQLA